MNSATLCNHRASVRPLLLLLSVVVLAGTPVFGSLTAQTVGRYSADFATGLFNPNQPRFSSDTQQLVDEVRLLIEEAERSNAADPLFLQDLRTTADRFFWPWRNVVLFDDFADGDFAANPQWFNPGGRASVEPGFGLVLDGTSGGLGVGGIGGGVPPGFASSGADSWTGSARSYDFAGSSVEAPSARRAIKMVGSLQGDFTFHFRIGAEASSTAIIGLFPTSSDSSFRSTSGTGRIDRMSQSWWIVGDGHFWQGNRQQGNVNMQPGDIVEFLRRGDVISIAINGIAIHDFSEINAGPVRALIAQSGTSRFQLEDVSWSDLGTGAAATVLKQSASSEWDGAVSSFSFAGNDVLGETPNRAIRTRDALVGDFRFLMKIGPRSTFNASRIGLYDTNEDFRFDPNDQTGGMRDMTNSWYVMSETLRYGCCQEGTLDLAKGNILEFRRIGDQISVLVNDRFVQTFTAGSTGPVRPVIGRGSFRIGRLDIDNISWTVPAPTNSGPGNTVPGGLGSGGSESTLDAILTALLAASGVPGQFVPENNAVLVAPVRVAPSFAFTAIVTANDSRRGRFEFGVLRRSNAFGYRVSVSTASFPALQLIRSDNNGDTVLAVATPPFNLADGNGHLYQLTRRVDGRLTLSVNGATLMTTTDQRFQSEFDVLGLFVQDGLFTVQGTSLLDQPF